jgi:uncharacterized protein YeaO (DUF488 family)
MQVRVKRIYEKASPTDGVRVLVDRVWPRGLSKNDADIDVWLKDLAPTTRLRKWFGHDPDKWPEFKRRYASELIRKGDLIDDLLERAKRRKVTLLFSARERRFNNAVALKEYLESSLQCR